MAAPPIPPRPFRTSAAARPLVLSGGFRSAQGAPGPGRLVARPKCHSRPSAAVAARGGDGTRSLLQAAFWGADAAYILWLFLLRYAPGDPVWAISQATSISDLIGLSLNFFFILPLLNSETLFNFVIAWTLMLAPLLFTDSGRDRYKGTLEALRVFHMFLTNTFVNAPGC